MEVVVPSNDVIRTFKKIEEEIQPAEKLAEKSDNEIGQLSVDPRWLKMKETLDQQIAQWERQIPIEVTDTPESVGFRYIAARLVAGALKAVRDLPDAIAQGVDIHGAEQSGESNS